MSLKFFKKHEQRNWKLLFDIFGNKIFGGSFFKMNFQKKDVKHHLLSVFIFSETENRKQNLKTISKTTQSCQKPRTFLLKLPGFLWLSSTYTLWLGANECYICVPWKRCVQLKRAFSHQIINTRHKHLSTSMKPLHPSIHPSLFASYPNIKRHMSHMTWMDMSFGPSLGLPIGNWAL